MILSVEAGGSADRAGILLGDILVTLDGQALQHVRELQNVLSGDAVGKSKSVRVIRGGKLVELTVTVAERSQRN